MADVTTHLDGSTADVAVVEQQRSGDQGPGQSRKGLVVILAAAAALLLGGVVASQRIGGVSEGGVEAEANAAVAGDGSIQGSLAPAIVDLDDYDQGDSLRIEIPLRDPDAESSEEAETDGENEPAVEVNSDLEPLRMVIADGALVLQGTARSQGQADAMIEQAKTVFGADQIVEEFDIDPSAPAASGGVVVQKPIVFETGSAEIRDEFKPILDACADVLKSNPSLIMNVSGHTDDTGSTDFNLELAESRAKAVVDYYVSQGIETETFDLTAAGSDQPIDSNETDDGRESNRRTDLEFVGIFDEVLDESSVDGAD